MKLPHPEQAIILESKLSGYCLNLDHPKGSPKARVFRAALGLTSQDSDELRSCLMQALRDNDAEFDSATEYGVKYVIYFTMKKDEKQAIIKSVWIVENETNFPRLISCYIPD